MNPLVEVFMILITQAPGGELSGAFAVQKSREHCDGRLPAIAAVVEASGTAVLESVCASGTWSFSPYVHGFEASSSDGEMQVYRVSFDEDSPTSVAITPAVDRSACESSLATASPRTYCVSSRQRLLGDDREQSVREKAGG